MGWGMGINTWEVRAWNQGAMLETSGYLDLSSFLGQGFRLGRNLLLVSRRVFFSSWLPPRWWPKASGHRKYVWVMYG